MAEERGSALQGKSGRLNSEKLLINRETSSFWRRTVIHGVITLLVLFPMPAADLYCAEPSVILSVYMVFFSTSCVVTTTSSGLPSIQACHFNKQQFDIRSWFTGDPISLTDTTHIEVLVPTCGTK
jgi:hypothetical protein